MGHEQVITTAGSEGKVASDNSVENVLDLLTSEERQLLSLIAQGFSDKTIAGKLGVQESRVNAYVDEIFPKIGIPRKDDEIDKRVMSVLLYQRNTPGFINPIESNSEDFEIISLTRRQKEVVGLIGQGYSNVKIGRQLNMSPSAVKSSIRSVLNERISVDIQTYSSRVVLALVSQTRHVA